MLNFIMGRIITAFCTLLLLTIVVFSIIRIAPGDPARMLLPLDTDEKVVEDMRRTLGLDKPLAIQYLIWLKNAVQFDFGNSIGSRYSAAQLFFERLPATLELALVGITISVCFAIPIGILAAIKRNALGDFIISFISLFGLSTPRFWLGIVLILIFSLNFNWLPPFGRGPGLFKGVGHLVGGDFKLFYQALKHLILPSITLATWVFAIILKYTRASVLEELGKLYVKTARQKGISEVRVMLIHVIRNALIPIITVIGLQVSVLLGGAVVTEIVFAWPGVGQLMIQALFSRDYPLIQASLFLIGSMIVFISILLDIIYVFLDPRIMFKNSNK